MPSTISDCNHPAHAIRSPRPTHTKRKLLAVGALGLAGFVAGLLSGCAGNAAVAGSTNPVVTGYARLAGNWGFRAVQTSTATGTQLTAFGGSLAVNGSAVTAMLHALTPGQCLASTEFIALTGSVDATGHLTLSGTSADGVAVIIAGNIAPDRLSLEEPTLSATGGHCVAPAAIHASASPRDNTGTTAQQYQPVSGIYTGTLTTAEGESFSLTTTVTQLDQPDASGIYHVQGTAASTGNSCLPGTVPATASALSGGTLSTTYTDSTGTTTITAAGSASPDGRTLTLTSWSLTSVCGSDTGTGTLIQQ